MSVPEPEQLTCSVCGNEPAVGVAAIPGVPASDAYGEACLKANAHPIWALVANTAILGGLEDAADWWVAMVDDTLRHLDMTREEFDGLVAKMLHDEQEYLARHKGGQEREEFTGD